MCKALFSFSALRLLAIFTAFAFLVSCHRKGHTTTETLTSGTIQISADESFKPVIDAEVKVFEASHEGANIIVHYKPEAACIRDLDNDSIRMVIITRGLTADEESLMTKQMNGGIPRYGKLAFDAIAVLVNGQSKDTAFDMADIRAMVKGDTTGRFGHYKVVLDGLSATSTVRYVADSLAAGQPLGKNVMAATSSRGVIDYISNNEGAIGMVGVSWIGNPEDEEQVNLLKKLKIALIECVQCQPVVYLPPSQYNIATRRYPLVRALYYVLKENYDGLGSGFTNFLIYERGQLIFQRAYLWPAKMDLNKRNAKIDE
ncbi:MAG TPA: substrate-binding domain-containing protein [Chitinophagaceae bacterium]|jgi:phosphate transport system substrate-binding protein